MNRHTACLLAFGAALLSSNDAWTAPEPTLAQRAHAAYSNGDPMLAYQLYQFALQADEQDAQLHDGLGALALQRQDDVQARIHFQRSLHLAPDNPVARAGLGLLTRGSEPDSALHSALQQHPESSALLHTQGYQQAHRGRWAEAAHSFRRLTQRHPDTAEYHYNLAVSLDHLGAHAEALPHYRRACAQPLRPPFPTSHCLGRIQALAPLAPESAP